MTKYLTKCTGYISVNLTTGECLDAFTLNREKNFTSTNIDFENLLFCYYYCENWVKQHPTQIKDNEGKKRQLYIFILMICSTFYKLHSFIKSCLRIFCCKKLTLSNIYDRSIFTKKPQYRCLTGLIF